MEDELEYQDFTDPSEEFPVSNAESGIICIFRAILTTCSGAC
jgi:hypothetical protein